MIEYRGDVLISCCLQP